MLLLCFELSPVVSVYRLANWQTEESMILQKKKKNINLTMIGCFTYNYMHPFVSLFVLL
jgi:hypothetical protein